MHRSAVGWMAWFWALSPRIFHDCFSPHVDIGSGPGCVATDRRRCLVKGHRLQLSAAYGDGIFHTQNLRNFAARVGADTQHALEIDVVSNSALKPMAQVLPALKRNEIQFGEVLMSSYVDIHPLLAMDSLPFIVRGFDEAARLWQLTRPVLQEFLLAQQGVRLLFAVPWPAQGLFCRRPVNSIVDLRGLRLRVQSDATKRLAELWGAQPVVLAAGDLGMVLEQEVLTPWLHPVPPASTARLGRP